MASTSASSVRMLTVKPSANASTKAPMIEMGIARTGTIVARRLLRNTSTTSTTSAMATRIVSRTSWIDSAMNSDES